MKALPIKVYVAKGNGDCDCTNGGISSRYEQLLLVCEDGHIKIDESNPPENLVKVCDRNGYKFLEPIARPEHLGWMFGGNIAYSSDGRFSELAGHPLPIHDRQETQELYDLLTRD